MGLAGAAASTAVETYPRYLTASEPELVRMNSLNSTATFASVIVGPLAAGAVADAFTTALVFTLLLGHRPRRRALCLCHARRLVPCREGQPRRDGRRGREPRPRRAGRALAPLPARKRRAHHHREPGPADAVRHWLPGQPGLWRVRLAREPLLPRRAAGGRRVDGVAHGNRGRGCHAGVRCRRAAPRRARDDAAALRAARARGAGRGTLRGNAARRVRLRGPARAGRGQRRHHAGCA